MPENRVLEGIIDKIADAVVAINPDGKILFWNESAKNIFGYTAQESVGQTVFDLIVPEDRKQETIDAIQRVLKEGSIIYESVRVRKDGALVYVDISKTAVRNEQGELKYIAVSKKDITDLKVFRDSRLIQSKFGELLESTPDATLMVNDAGRIVSVNNQAEFMFGYARNQLLGKPVEILLPERFRLGHIHHRTSYFVGPRKRPMGAGLELFGSRPDGSEFPVEISLSPIETDEGIWVMAAVRDVTERKRFQQAVQEKNIELEKANRAKDNFLATMSHELRTPLNSIIGFSEFLIDEKPGKLNDKQKEYLRDVLNSGNHLLHLINDILDLAKVQAGKMQLSPEQFDVKHAIDEICSTISPLAHEKSLTINVNVPKAGIHVVLDLQRFKQILFNLISNAVKFNRNGGKIEINAEKHNGSLQLKIEDTGIGINKAQISGLFQEFQQLDKKSSKQQGTGLGLALTKRIIELQNGSIHVESEEGIGSTFTILIPQAIE